MPSVSTRRVLARPGTPIKSIWPPASMAARNLVDHPVLAENDAAHRLPYGGKFAPGILDRGPEDRPAHERRRGGKKRMKAMSRKPRASVRM